MKKTLLTAAIAAAVGTFAASAQAVQQPGFFQNWQIGLDGGVVTPMKNHPFFDSMRGAAGVHIAKQLTPVTTIGVEGLASVNTSSWGTVKSKTVFDNTYLGAYGTVDLFNLFGGYNCEVRPFTIQAKAGMGWARDIFNPDAAKESHNFLAVNTGLNFAFNVSDHVTLGLNPTVLWHFTETGFNGNKAAIGVLANVSYNFGPGFECVLPYNQAEVDLLNAQVNELRAGLATAIAANGIAELQNAQLAAALDSCMNAGPKVVKETEVANIYNSVRFVFFKIGSAQVTKDQMPNVEMIADYMKNHPDSKVVIKGYASADGNYDFNLKLAENRAKSVRDLLVSRYKVNPDRIVAQGEGIGKMFTEESWNRVSICTLEAE